MQSDQFEQFFDPSLFEHFFLGVFSSDNYPKKIKPNHFFIFNKDKSHEPGSHWLACYSNGESIELFDSLGTSKEIVDTLLSFSEDFICYFNESPVQPNTSNSCGQFCVYFLYKRFFNRELSMKYCINLNFSTDLSKNDTKVRKFCKEILK